MYKFIEITKLKDEFIYRVRANENLAALADMFEVSERKIIADNSLTEEVHAGQLVIIKKFKGKIYTVLPGDTLENLALKFNLKPQEILEKNNTDIIYPFMKLHI